MAAHMYLDITIDAFELPSKEDAGEMASESQVL